MTDRNRTIRLSRQVQNDIARQNSRAHGVVEEIWTYVEQLSNASSRSDWIEVQRLARLIVMDSLVFGVEDLGSIAEKLNEDLCDEPGSIACQRGIEQLRTILGGRGERDDDAPDAT